MDEDDDGFERIAGRMAHHMNNLVSVIQICAELLAESQTLEESERADVATILHACDGLGHLGRSLAVIGGLYNPRGPLEADPVRVAEEAVASLSEDLQDLRVVVETGNEERERALARIGADDLRRVLVELLTNAREAAVAGSEIAVTLERAATEVIVTVTNEIPADLEIPTDQIGVPFHTTRGPGRLGLGFTVAAALLAGVGGSLSARRVAGSRVSVEVRLPAANHDNENSGSTSPPT